MNKMIQRSKKLKNRKGFTLIELIVVIVIIGILAAVIIPNLIGFGDSAKKKADLATARTLATAAATVYADDPDAAAEEYEATGAIDDLLPSDFDWTTQLTGNTFEVTITAGGITVTDGTDTIFPESAATGEYE